MHRVLVETMPKPGEVAAIEGDEARHALRVKRVRGGEQVELLDGRGGVALGEVVEGGRDELRVRIRDVRHVEPTRPRVEVWTAVPKGGRVDEMIDQLAQAGAASWGPLETARGVVEPRESKMERLERIAREASKQCGRAWTLAIAAKQTAADALRGGEGVRVVVADSSGGGYRRDPGRTNTIRLLIGPEGGWTPEELAAAGAAGATIAAFGPHVMRIETAAVVACGAVLATES